MRFPNIRFLQHFINSTRNNQTAERHVLIRTLLKQYVHFMKFIDSHPQEKHRFSFTNQGCTNFPKIREGPLNSRRQKGSSGYQATLRHVLALAIWRREFVHCRGRLAVQLCVWRQSLFCDSQFSFLYGDSRCLVSHSSVMCMETVAVL